MSRRGFIVKQQTAYDIQQDIALFIGQSRKPGDRANCPALIEVFSRLELAELYRKYRFSEPEVNAITQALAQGELAFKLPETQSKILEGDVIRKSQVFKHICPRDRDPTDCHEVDFCPRRRK
jgi:hypothetical protein